MEVLISIFLHTRSCNKGEANFYEFVIEGGSVAHSKTCAIQIVLSLMFLLSLPLLIQRPLRRSIWRRVASRSAERRRDFTFEFSHFVDQIFSPECDQLRTTETFSDPTFRSYVEKFDNDQNDSDQPTNDDKCSDSPLTMTPRIRRKHSSVPFLISFLTGKPFQTESHSRVQAYHVHSGGIPEPTPTDVLVI